MLPSKYFLIHAQDISSRSLCDYLHLKRGEKSTSNSVSVDVFTALRQQNAHLHIRLELLISEVLAFLVLLNFLSLGKVQPS